MPYGVSNSFKRATMRTYSRQRTSNRALLDSMSTDQARVRITMTETGHVRRETITAEGTVVTVAIDTSVNTDLASNKEKDEVEASSPVSRGIFSETSEHTQITSASPPSSPPPQQQLPTTTTTKSKRASPPKQARKLTFNSNKRKRSQQEDTPLSETDANTSKRPSTKRTRLTQMQLDLGGETCKTCKECGMEYNSTSREDTKLHNEFHAMNLGGVEMGTGFAKESKKVQSWGYGENVVMVDSKSAFWLKKRVQRVLDVVKADLGAVDIPEEELWGFKDDKNSVRMRKHDSTEEEDNEAKERYKAFLYLAGDKCVGLCLAERLRNRNAQKVVSLDTESGRAAEARPGMRSSCIRAETSYEPMLLGISRIWVGKSHRRKKLAETLLDSARANFFFGIDVPKKMVAFSQPTESGGKLAEFWFEAKEGWHVYSEY